jgi:hypothetical protein
MECPVENRSNRICCSMRNARGSLLNGVQRNIIVSSCTSMASDTAHFDTHNPAENVSYVGCVAIGGVPAPQPATQEVIGFQMRAANSSIVGMFGAASNRQRHHDFRRQGQR